MFGYHATTRKNKTLKPAENVKVCNKYSVLESCLETGQGIISLLSWSLYIGSLSEFKESELSLKFLFITLSLIF